MNITNSLTIIYINTDNTTCMQTLVKTSATSVVPYYL